MSRPNRVASNHQVEVEVDIVYCFCAMSICKTRCAVPQSLTPSQCRTASIYYKVSTAA